MKKSSLLFSIGVSILFVMLGLFLYFEKSAQNDISNPTLIKIAGISCIIFFGTITLIGIKKFFSSNQANK